MIDLAKKYTDWLYKNMTQEKIDDNLYELTTPFLDRHNDYTQIYIKYNSDSTITISDYGYKIDDLLMSGFNFESSKRKHLLNQVINKFGLSLNGDVIYTNVTNLNSLPEAKHRLLQAMIYINDMFILNRANVQSLFYEDVAKYFEIKNIPYFSDFSLTGKSKLSHNFDFALPKTISKPERLIKLMNSPNRTDLFSQIMFSWDDTKPQRDRDSSLIVILNDYNKVSKKVTDGFKSYEDSNVIAMPWSDIDNQIEKLA